MASGRLHVYCKERKLCAFEHLPDVIIRHAPPQHKNALLFIGGLGDNFLSVPLAEEIAETLASENSSWSVFEIQLSSLSSAWGVSNLDNDVADLNECVRWARDDMGKMKIVIMGHSTGSQDVLHYCYHRTISRPQVDGAVLQAPVSDREALMIAMKAPGRGQSKTRTAYEDCLRSAQYSTSTEVLLLPREDTATLGYGDVWVSAERFLSLASPQSPEHPSSEDLFSSDLSDQTLCDTFGRIDKKVLATQFLLILISGADEHVPEWVDKKALLRRWELALKTSGVELHERSAVMGGTSHNGQTGEGVSSEIVDRVTEYLKTVENQ